MNSMSASMMPSPPGPASPAAAAPAAAAPALPGMPLAAPFSAWLGLVAQAGQGAVPAEGEDAADEPSEADSQDGAVPALALDGSTLPAMTPPMAMPIPMPVSTPMPAAAPGADASDRFADARAPLVPVGAALPAAIPAVAVLMAAPAASQLASAPVAAAPSPSAGQGAASASAPAPAAAAGAEAPARFEVLPAASAVSGTLGLGALAPALDQGLPAALKLTGTPPDWQQPLREALGERLQLQLGRNADTAVIRLDPPMLGRIEISIRHAAGALEVNISATHSEVVRQLHTISDSMRSDLAQRQFSEVAVSVVAAPRSGAAPSGEQQGRQRQPGPEQDEAGPGRGLAEAGQPSSAFSLNGRESST